MKRFLVIFAICFASIIGVFGGVYGIKFLKGDFKEVVVNPENISFELSEYDVTDDFKILISTTTENVNAKKITLTFEKGTSFNTYGKDYITDGVIIIPKQVTLGQEFDVRLFRTNDNELDGIEWIKGGISNLVATSECITTPKATAKVCVDVPVYKTEIVLFGGESEIATTNDYSNYLTYIEGQNSITKQQPVSFNAGDTFYLGLKFYPERSAYRYSKISSSNMLIEYQSQIMQKLTELDLDYTLKFNALQKLFTGSSDMLKLSFDELINTYSQIINLNGSQGTSKEEQFAQYLTTLNNAFNKNLKFYTIEENALNEKTYTNKIERVAGTNLYKFQATTDSTSFTNKVDVQLYSYAFYNSLIEDNTLLASSDYNSLLITLENLFGEQGQSLANKKVDKATLDLSIVDVDVDTIEIAGQINDFSTNKIHTIYASQNGTNSETTSYLNIKLSNSNIASVDLQNKILNVGIRFEKRLSTSTWGDAIEVKFVDEHNYTTVKYDGNTYYLPLGNSSTYVNSYWQIYSDEYISNDLRAVLVYFKAYQNNGEENIATEEKVKLVADNPIFRLIDANANEQMIKWSSTEDITIGVVNMTGVVDLSETTPDASEPETTMDVAYNKEVDLSKLVSIPEGNNFQTYKFFIYTDEAENGNYISSYFYTTDQESKPYTFSGITKNLYELDGNILKLKGSAIPEYSVNVIFATIKTGALRNPLLNEDGTYKIAKYSAVKNSLVENLSSLSINFTNSVSTLVGDVVEIKGTVAGIAQSDNKFKIAQNSTDVLKIKISGGKDDSSIINDAIINNTLKIEAREDKNNLANYISYRVEQEGSENYFVISTLSVLKDTTIRLYFVYTIDGNDYLFPIIIKSLDKNNTTFNSATIVYNTNSEVYFDFIVNQGGISSSVLLENVEYINVITSYDSTNGFEKSYTVKYYNDDINTPTVTIFEDNSNKIRVKVLDFLDNTITTGLDNEWFLTSSDPTVISIQNNQNISFVSSSASVITLNLYLGNDDNYEWKQLVNFKIESSGRVQKVVANENTSEEYTVFEYNSTIGELYGFQKQNIKLTRFINDSVVLDNLLKIYYHLNGEDVLDPITMDIRVANEASLEVLKAIGKDFNNGTVNSDNLSTTTILTSFKLNKNIGSVLSIDFLFTSTDLGITQVVSLKLTQIVSIQTLTITNVINDSEIKQKDSKYEVFTGITYKVVFNTLNVSNENNKFYWHNDIDGDNAKHEITISQIDGSASFEFSFPDSTKKNSGKIHIISSNSFETGDLDYILDFIIQNNVVLDIKDSVKTTMLSGNTATIYLKDIFARKDVSGGTIENCKLVYTNIDYDYKTEYALGNEKIISISCGTDALITADENRYLSIEFSDFIDELNISFYILCDELRMGDKINIKIVPENLQNSDKYFALYKDKKAIVLSNGEYLSTDNDATNIFIDMFKTGATVTYDGAFNGTYTTKDGTNRKVVTSSTNLFTDTEFYVSVKKDNITSKYLIIISKLSFPFVEFKTEKDNVLEPLSYSNLDIYYLFENTVDLYNYYNQKDIAFFTTSDEEINLFGEGEDGIFNNKTFNSITNDANFTDFGLIEMATGDDLASNYAQLSAEDKKNIKLTTKPVGVVGGVFLKVYVKLAQKGTSVYYNVPIVVHLPQTQILDVSYPNSNVAVSFKEDVIPAGYGSEEYDNILTETLLPFGNKYMEYLKFAVNGKATLDLVGGKFNMFKVQKFNGTNYVDDDSYNAGFTFSIEKIVKNVSGAWYEVDKSDFINHASIVTENGITTLRIEKYLGLDIVRLKLKITSEGGAVNYYYVSAGEVEELTLMRQEYGGLALSIGATDSITLKSKESILIGAGIAQTADEKYYYYLSNLHYNSELKFRIVKDGKVVELDVNKENDYIKVTDNKLTMQVQPLGSNFVIEIYTMYGVLSSINVTISPAYTFEFVGDNLYSGTEYSRDEIFTISTDIYDLSTNVSAITVLDDSELYTCDANKFTFGHIAEKQTFNMQLEITVDGYTFSITFNNVKLLPRIINQANYNESSNAYVDEEGTLTTYTVDNGIINIDKAILNKLFKDATKGEIDFGDFNDLEFYVDNEPWEDISLNYACEIGAIIDTINPRMRFVIKSNGTIIASAFALITIHLQYEVIINYPVTISSISGEEVDFGCEYVQSGGKINFADNNFNMKNRIEVIDKTNPETPVAYVIKHNGVVKEGEIIFEKNSNEEFTNYELKVCIDNLTYATYLVKVGSNSPFSFTQKQETVYVSYGDDDLFGKVDVIVTLPTISSLNAGDKISLYVASEAGSTDGNEEIASNIYYRANERIRAVLNLIKYKKGISKVFVKVGNSISTTDVECIAEFNVRGELTYNGNNVRYQDYANIISKINLNEIEKTFINNECEIKNITLKTTISIVDDKTDIANDLFVKYLYDISFNSDLLSGDDEPKITLNANEQVQGYSFVDLFDLRDDLGNKFWYNNISASKKMNLQVAIAVGAINCLPLDPQIKDGNIYDYMLKPVGASNNGTIVKLTFTYSLGRTDLSDYKVEFNVKIVSDIEYALYNNDGTTTQNSETNPLKVTYNANKVLLVSAQQTNYIYACSKYASSPKPNLVQNWAEPEVSGDKDFFTIVKEDNKLYLQFNKNAEFGNKKLVVKFTDPYNFTFKYYIEFIATIGVSTISTDSGKVFEGDSIYVYNKNSSRPEDAGKKGINITLVQGSSTDTTNDVGFAIKSATFSKNDTSYDIIKVATGSPTDKIEFLYLSFDDIWNNSELSNGLSFTGKLKIYIVNYDKYNTADEEVFSFEIPFTIYKRYSSEIIPQNTFVRENVPINLAHFIDVYDYKQESYLGRPSLTELEEISATIDLHDVKIKNGDVTISLYDHIETERVKIVNADAVLNNPTSTGEEKSQATDNKNTAINNLKKYGIIQKSSETYGIDDFKIYLQIKAKHKTSSIIISKEQSFDIKNDGTVGVNITLGEEKSPFGAGVNVLNYDFEYWLFDIENTNVVTNGKIATTIESDVGTIDDSKIYQISTGSLYNVKITNSDAYSGIITIALNVDGTVTRITQYKEEDGALSYKEIKGGSHDFKLYDYRGKTVSLYTGIFEGTTYVNGLSDVDVLNSKNISSGGIYNVETNNYSEDLSYTAKITSETLSSSEEFGISYQLEPIKYTLKYLGFDKDDNGNKNRFETRDNYSLLVTPTFTGIDTTKAYSPSIHYCYDVNFKYVNDTIEQTTVSLDKWSQGFELMAGIGVSAILAENEDKTFYGSNTRNGEQKYNKEYLIFEPGNVISTSSGTQGDNNSFAIDADGNITLLAQFKPNEYYISILVYCKYGSPNDKGVYNKVLLETIYVAFVDVDPVNVYRQTGNKYTLDISEYIGDQELGKEDITLGLAKTFDLNDNIVTFDDDGINSIEHDKMYLLKVGTRLQYVRLNVCSIQYTAGESISVSKSGNKYIIASDVLEHFEYISNNISKTLNEKGTISYLRFQDMQNGKSYYFNYTSTENEEITINTFEYIDAEGTSEIVNKNYLFIYEGCSCEVNITVS